MRNIWVVAAKVRRLEKWLAKYVGRRYHDVASEMTAAAMAHRDWCSYFAVFSEISNSGIIQRVRVKIV